MSNLFKYTLLAIICITLSFEGNAQVQNVLDGAYVKETNLTKRVIPYPYLREADVMYFRRIWQEMDLKQKINHPYYYPVDPIEDRSNLFDVIRDGLLIEGSLVAYSTGPVGDEDEFTIPLSPDSIRKILNPIERIDEWDEFGEKIGFKEIITPIESDKITRYRLKEDWIWDRQRSERYVRIIGIAPMIEDYDRDGDSMGYAPLFW
ncbi:MAG: gliding motility protein GldN, partial [Flavobacteriales bacterium]|nr:gliding motility protein GldN [Flavobacteriales bacterium]